ncbi:hypothetical protein D3C72_1591690 [compost metagenome]
MLFCFCTVGLFLVHLRDSSNLNCLFQVQLTGVPFRISTVIIIYTVSGIRALLCLEDDDAFAQGMQRSAWNVEEVACFDRYLGQELIPFPFMYPACQFFLALCTMTIDDLSSWLSIYDIPALCLPKLAILVFPCIGIVWVNLYREII